jgi:phage gpG-like protein
MANDQQYVISRRVLRSLGKTLDDPRRILTGIRSILKSQSQEAFKAQRFGDIIWPARYPKQKAPKLNVAGAVQDLATGPRIKARRFEDRPALLDTGILRRSIAAEIAGDTVNVGTKVPYAKIHQSGGVSQQPITPTIKANLATVLKYGDAGRTKAGKPRKIDVKTQMLRKRLGFLFGVPELVTKIHARPFLGLTDAARAKCEMVIEDAFGPNAKRVS